MALQTNLYIRLCRSTCSHATMNMNNLVTHKNATKEIMRREEGKPRAGGLDLFLSTKPIPSIQRSTSVYSVPHLRDAQIYHSKGMHTQYAIPIREKGPNPSQFKCWSNKMQICRQAYISCTRRGRVECLIPGLSLLSLETRQTCSVQGLMQKIVVIHRGRIGVSWCSKALGKIDSSR